MIKYLVERNVSLNVQESSDRMTPLMISVSKGNLEMTRFLIEHGANLEFLNKQKNTALMIAAGRSKDTDKNNINTSLLIVKKLLEKNADVDVQNAEGKTALMIALEERNDEIAIALIEHGANLDLVDEYGETALIFATRYCNDMKLFEMLIKKNVDMDIQNLDRLGDLVFFNIFQFKIYLKQKSQQLVHKPQRSE
jgi:ankyrin repeat protein